MRKETGWITTILMALAAVLGFTALPKSKSGESAGDKARSESSTALVARASREAAPQELKESPCWQLEKSLLTFIDARQYAAPDSCLKDADRGKLKPENPTKHAQLRFVVATLPDPVHTHFPLLFDRLTEALQQAAQDQGYNYDSSWLPWTPDGKSSETQKDSHGNDQQAAQQMQPGVLVFRKALPAKSDYCAEGKTVNGAECKPPGPYHAGVVVFVVGENATGGIDQEQFRNAFEWIDVLTGTSVKQQPKLTEGDRPRQKAAILGPYFSGSLPSLYEAMLANGIAGIKSTDAGEKPTEQGAVAKKATNGKKAQNATQAQQTQPSTSSTEGSKTAGGQTEGTGESVSTSLPKTFPVFSGSLSSKAGIDWFTTVLQPSSAQFFSFQQNDDYMIDTYCLYLRNQGYDTGNLAIISEDETAYGFSLPAHEESAAAGETPSARKEANPLWLPDCDSTIEARSSDSHSSKEPKAHGPLYVYYPRDIAALRSAYDRQQQSSGTGKSQSTTAPALPLDLAEPGSRERDTITSFGESQTTLSQEATLFGISNLFKAHDIQFIVLRSSNTLDQVFLANFFSRTDPSARVVLTNADLLFRRSSETTGFRGTMTLTTYPLLTWQQDWTHWQTPQSRHSHRAFPEDTAEGLYLAARLLIDLDSSKVDTIPDGSNVQPLVLTDRAIDIQDYAPPSWLLKEQASSETKASETDEGKKPGKTATPTRPPVWLSVVGSGQLWPVAVMGDDIPEAAGPSFYPGTVTRATRAPDAPADTLPWVDTASKAEHLPDFQLPFPMFLCCVVILAWSVWHFFCCLFGSHTSSVKLGSWKLSPSSFRSLAYFAPVPRRQHRWLIFIGCLITWMLAIEIAAAVGILHGPPYALEYPWRAICYCLLLGALSWGALLANYRTYLPPKWQKEEPRLTPAAAAAASDSSGANTAASALAATDNPAATDKKTNPPRFDVRLMGLGAALFAVAAFSVFWIFHGWILASLGPGAKVFAMWRSINLFTGVSATVPMLLLTAGLYGWFWYSLGGLGLFNSGVPKLPHEKELLVTMPMFTREGPGKRIQDAAIPLKGTFGRHFMIFALSYFAFWQLAGDATSIRALGPVVFGKVYAVWFGLLIVLVLTESSQMLRTWGELRELLTYLDRLPLRRTLQALGGISWGTVWKMSGNILEQRYRLLSRQMESLRHLENELAAFRVKCPKQASILAFGEVRPVGDGSHVPLLYEQIDECNAARDAFVKWYAGNYHESQYGQAQSNTVQSDLSVVGDFQKKLASTAAVILRRVLLPAWQSETDSLILEPSASDKDNKAAPTLPKDEYVRAAEEFFCLPYLGFIQNILGRIRTMTLAIIWLFLGATLSVASYPFDPRPITSGIFVVVFFAVAAVMTFVYAEMHRDPTLSHITNTNPGELGADFWMKLITFGVGPLLGLLTALFPDITGFLTSWLQPAVGSIK